MTRTQEFLSTMLHRLPKWELSSYEHQATLDKIRERLTSAPDLHEELRRLYTVKNYSQFALSLMWMAEKVDHNSQKYESTPEEDEKVFSFFKQAIGEDTSTTASPASDPAPTFSFPTSVEEVKTDFTATPPASSESMWADFTSFNTASFDVPQAVEPAPANQSVGESFAPLLDQFLQAIQSGSEDRTKIMEDVLQQCSSIRAGGQFPDDAGTFYQYLQEFLEYVQANQLIDDIRVMNIISNIQGPYAQWEQASPESRTGVLDSAIDILKDFKTMFE